MTDPLSNEAKAALLHYATEVERLENQIAFAYRKIMPQVYWAIEVIRDGQAQQYRRDLTQVINTIPDGPTRTMLIQGAEKQFTN